MRPSIHKGGLVAAALAIGIPAAAAAQPVVEGTAAIGFDRPEAWAMKWVGSLSLLSGFGPPEPTEPGSLALALETGSIPHLSREDRRVGFDGTKVEDMNQAPVLVRPRAEVGLPWDLTLSVAYVPPVRVFDVEPNLLALGLGRPVLQGKRLRLGVRLHGQLGRIRATVTCPAEVVAYGEDPVNNPFGCEAESWDTTRLRSASVELSGAYRIEGWRGLTPHLAVALNAFDTEFQVNAPTFGFIDRLRLTTSGTTVSLAGGFRLPLAASSELGIDLFYTPLRVRRPEHESTRTEALLNVRALLAYRLR